MRGRAAARGFTLVEVLVALVIMAVLAAMAWQGVDAITRTRETTDARFDRTLRLNTVLAQWQQDLDSVEDTNFVPALVCDGASLRMTRRAGNGISLVAWVLRQGRLMRWASPPVATIEALQDGWLRSLQLVGNEAGQLVMLDGISDWQIYFFEQKNAFWSNCQSTGDAAPAPSLSGSAAAAAAAAAAPLRSGLPKGVRVVMSFAENSGYSGSLTRDMMVPPSASAQ